MPAYTPGFDPVALPDDVVRLLPDGELRRVESLEPLAEIGPVDFGSVDAESNLTVSGRDVIENEATEMRAGQLGQYRIEPLSPVRLQVNQDNRRDDRFSNADRQGKLSPSMPANLTELYVLGDGNPYFRVENPNPYALDATYVMATGFKYVLSSGPIPESEVSGQPKSIPVDKLEKQAQENRSAALGGD